MNNTMRAFTRVLMIVLVALSCVVTTAAQTPPQTEQQKTFVPLSEAPQQEQIPSSRLVISAYSFVVLALFVYVLSLSRRLSSVKQELDRFERDTSQRARRA